MQQYKIWTRCLWKMSSQCDSSSGSLHQSGELSGHFVWNYFNNFQLFTCLLPQNVLRCHRLQNFWVLHKASFLSASLQFGFQAAAIKVPFMYVQKNSLSCSVTHFCIFCSNCLSDSSIFQINSMPIQSSTGRYNNIDLYAYSLYCISRKGFVGPMGKVKEYILVWPDLL